MLQDYFIWYLEHQNELVKEYNNRFIVIFDNQVIGDYDNLEHALFQTIEKGYELGTFLIQECTEGEEAYTQTFHSRVIFA